MKNITNYPLIWIFVFYFLFSYFFFPYLSSIINPANIFEINNKYSNLVFFCLLIFLITVFLIKKFYPTKESATDQTDPNNILMLAYILFIFGFISKIQNVLNNNHKNFLYSDIESNLFLVEYFFSMNAFTLLSILLFVTYFYNRKKNENNFLFLLLLPLLYFILYISFSPGGRFNLIFIFLLIFNFEFIKIQNFKLFIFKILFILTFFFFSFNFIKISKDVTLLNQVNVHVYDLNKKIYFTSLTTNKRKLHNVLFSENFIFFLCKKNLDEYEDKNDFSYYKICKNDPNNAKFFNINKFAIYNFTARLNNYRPLNSLLNLLDDHKLKERSLGLEIKNRLVFEINKFLNNSDSKIIYESNLEVDNFNILSGIVRTSSEAGLSATVIGELYWIGGYFFLFLYFATSALLIYLLNYLFLNTNIIYKVFTFFFSISYISTFEQSVIAHIFIFFKNLLIMFFCVILVLMINKFRSRYKKNANDL
jgi:hypothetical protein